MGSIWLWLASLSIKYTIHSDDARKGWLSGLSEKGGDAHFTRGGLRIGKPLPERQPAEPPDRELEWDQDGAQLLRRSSVHDPLPNINPGQYLHYLTKWMQTLAAMARRAKLSTSSEASSSPRLPKTPANNHTGSIVSAKLMRNARSTKWPKLLISKPWSFSKKMKI